MDIDGTSTDQSRIQNGDASRDNAMDVDNSSSSPDITGTQPQSTETVDQNMNGDTTNTGLQTDSQFTRPQTVNTADIFSIPPPPSDAASTDNSMTDTHPPPSASLPARTQAPTSIAGPSSVPPWARDTSFASPVSATENLSLSRRQASPSPPKIYRTGYIYDPLMMLHCPDGYTPTADSAHSGLHHPEEPMRIKRIFTRLAEHGLVKRMKKLDFGEVTFEQVILVHSEGHWDKVQGTECESQPSW
jgi:hypothetical protein